MSFDPPRLDDADAAALLAAARAALSQRGGGWQADDAADPGVALLEAFAHITAEELRRLNRLPEAAYTAFLSLLGARLRPGAAAMTRLRLTLAAARSKDTLIAAGIRVSAPQTPDVVFTTLEPAVIAAGATEAEVAAAQVGRMEDALAGHGTGAPGQRMRLPHRPLPGAPALASAIAVFVEPGPAGIAPGAVVVQKDGTDFIQYEPVPQLLPDDTGAVFEVDRVAGVITFPRSGLYIPAEGAEIRTSYSWMEGGPHIALPAHALTEPLSPLSGITITNSRPVEPGLPPETTEKALRRGPISAFTGGSAVKARDYEALALKSHPAVARAHAAARSERWLFARPGSVEVLIAPEASPGPAGAVTAENIAAATSPGTIGEEALDAVTSVLQEARPLGVTINVSWMSMKAIGIGARLYAAPGADKAAIADAATARVNALLCPVPGGIWPDGWPLGRALRQSEVIETLAATPGVRAVDRVELRPHDPMTGPVSALRADSAQTGVWYAVIGGRLYRTLDDGAGWNAALEAGSAMTAVAAHPARTGLVAAADSDGAVQVSTDCGQSFQPYTTADNPPETMLWSDGGEAPRLLLAGPSNLSESSGPKDDPSPPAVQELLATDAMVGPAYAMASLPDGRGGRLVAVARRALGGIVLSNDSGWDGSYEPAGLAGHDVRALTFFETDAVIWLLAGCARPVIAGLHVCYAAPVDPDMGTVGEWIPADTGWMAGGISCLAAGGGTVFAGTRSDGLVIGSMADGEFHWRLPGPRSELPSSSSGTGRAGLSAVAVAPGRPDVVMAGGDGLVLISKDGGERFEDVTIRHGADRITLPADWTICADTHEIEVHDDVR